MKPDRHYMRDRKEWIGNGEEGTLTMGFYWKSYEGSGRTDLAQMSEADRVYSGGEKAEKE